MLENGAVAPLLEGLKHKKYEVRSACVYALGGFLFVRVVSCVCTFPPVLAASSNVFQHVQVIWVNMKMLGCE